MFRTLAAEAARRFGERLSFAAESAGSPQLSYADLDRLSDEAAAGFAHRGVLPGDVIAVVLPTTPEFPVCYLGAVKIGAIVAGLDPRWPAGLLDRLAELLRPTVTVAPFGLNIGPGPDGDLVRVALATAGRAILAGFRRAGPPPAPPPPPPPPPALDAFPPGPDRGPRRPGVGVSPAHPI